MGGGVASIKHAIDAVAQPQRLLKRLDVDVAGAVFDRLDQDEVGQFDDRGFLAGSRQLVQIDFLNRFLGNLDAVGVGLGIALLLGVLDDVLHAAALGGVDVVELVEDRLFRGDQRRHFEPGDAPDIVDGQHIQRIGHRQEQLVLQPRDGNDLVVVSHFARHQVRHFEGDAEAGQIDGRRVQDAAHGNRHVRFGHVGLFEDQLEQAGAVLLLLLEQFLDLFDGQQAVFHQRVGDALAKCFDRRHGFSGRLCGRW